MSYAQCQFPATACNPSKLGIFLIVCFRTVANCLVLKDFSLIVCSSSKKDFRGAQCQFPATACNPSKLGYNGGYNCTGTGRWMASLYYHHCHHHNHHQLPNHDHDHHHYNHTTAVTIAPGLAGGCRHHMYHHHHLLLSEMPLFVCLFCFVSFCFVGPLMIILSGPHSPAT